MAGFPGLAPAWQAPQFEQSIKYSQLLTDDDDDQSERRKRP